MNSLMKMSSFWNWTERELPSLILNAKNSSRKVK